MTEHDYRASLEWELGISPERFDPVELALKLSTALVALQMSVPRNGRGAELRRVSRRDLTEQINGLNRRAAA